MEMNGLFFRLPFRFGQLRLANRQRQLLSGCVSTRGRTPKRAILFAAECKDLREQPALVQPALEEVRVNGGPVRQTLFGAKQKRVPLIRVPAAERFVLDAARQVNNAASRDTYHDRAE